MKRQELEEIHGSLLNGQKRQMVNQIDHYGPYYFFVDYDNFLRDIFMPLTAYNTFADCVIAYHHIKNR